MTFSNIVGRWLEWKGLHVYLEAIETIDTDDQFELIGDPGDGRSLEYSKTLQRQIEKLGSKIVAKGFLDDMRAYYRNIDVLVHTSVAPDPLPTVLVEALAMGKILIASKAGGVPEIVPQGYGNLLVPPNDSHALAVAIKEVSRYDISKQNEISRRNRQYAYERFRLEKQIMQMNLLYRKQCSK